MSMMVKSVFKQTAWVPRADSFVVLRLPPAKLKEIDAQSDINLQLPELHEIFKLNFLCILNILDILILT